MSALSETQSEQSARTDRIQAVTRLPCTVPHLTVKIFIQSLTPAVHTLHRVGQHTGHPQKQDQHREDRRADGKPLDLDARYIEHDDREDTDDNDTGVMRFEQQQERGGEEYRRAGQDTEFERIHPIIVPAAPVRQKQDDRKFTDLRRLDTERTESDPSVYAALLRRQHQNQEQCKITQSEDDRGETMIIVVIQEGDTEHDRQTDQRKQELTFQIIIAVADLIIGDRITCREHHGDTDGEQYQDQQYKGDVDTFTDVQQREIDFSSASIVRGTTITLIIPRPAARGVFDC